MSQIEQQPDRTKEVHANAPRVLFLVCLVAIVFLLMLQQSSALSASNAAKSVESEQMPEPSGDFSKFQHSSANHARLPCLLCHRRETNSIRPALPGGSGHLPCAGCHKQQFANNESPICTICHTDVKSGALKAFPPLKSFRVNFDHSRHLRMGSVTCSTCHSPARGGIAMSIPVSFNAHAICFRCHAARAQSGGRDISSCGTCHKPGGYSRTPSTARAFTMSFSHAKHTGEGLTCNECHQVRAGMPQRRQVTTPEPANHHASGKSQSCMTCHNGKRAFGGDDFSVCKRCHTGNAWHF